MEDLVNRYTIQPNIYPSQSLRLNNRLIAFLKNNVVHSKIYITMKETKPKTTDLSGNRVSDMRLRSTTNPKSAHISCSIK